MLAIIGQMFLTFPNYARENLPRKEHVCLSSHVQKSCSILRSMSIFLNGDNCLTLSSFFFPALHAASAFHSPDTIPFKCVKQFLAASKLLLKHSQIYCLHDLLTLGS